MGQILSLSVFANPNIHIFHSFIKISLLAGLSERSLKYKYYDIVFCLQTEHTQLNNLNSSYYN